MISANDRNVLRGLAAQWMEFAALPVMQERKRLWRAVHDLQAERPVILFETDWIDGYLARRRQQHVEQPAFVAGDKDVGGNPDVPLGDLFHHLDGSYCGLAQRRILFAIGFGGSLADGLDLLRLALAAQPYPFGLALGQNDGLLFLLVGYLDADLGLDQFPLLVGGGPGLLGGDPGGLGLLLHGEHLLLLFGDDPLGLGLHELLGQIDLTDEHGDALHVVLLQVDPGAARGEAVRAVANGLVTWKQNIGAEGWVITIEHLLADGSKVWSAYWHVTEPPVSFGQIVYRGDVIGRITDRGDNSHLHWEIRTWSDGSNLFPPTSAGGRGTCNGRIPALGYTWDDLLARASPNAWGYVDPVKFVAQHRSPASPNK